MLKKCLNSVKTPEDVKKANVTWMCHDIICVLFPDMGCGNFFTDAPTTVNAWTVEVTDATFTEGVTDASFTEEFTEEVTDAADFTDIVTESGVDAYTASSDEYAVSDSTSGSVSEHDTCIGFEGLLEFVFGDCGCSEVK